MVCICSRRISGYPVKKTNSYDIENFINQLLSSQKFDELADIVAEKAVKKIKNIASEDHDLDKILVAKHSLDLGRMEQEKDRIHHSTEREGKKQIENESRERLPKKILRDDGDNPKHKGSAEEKHKDGSDKAKINTQVLMKKEPKSEEGELSLKYKNFKKHARVEKERNHQTADSGEHNPWTHLEHSKPKAQYFVPVIDDKEHVDEKHHSINSDSIENKYVKKNKKSTTRNQAHGKSKNDNDEIKDDELNFRPQFKSEQGDLPTIDVNPNDDKDKKSEASESPKHSHEDIEAAVENKPKRTSKIDMVWRSQQGESDKSDNEEDVKTIRVTTTGEQGYELGELTTKRLIRREGDRIYTYQSGAEYADFHEEMRKEQQNKKSDHLY